MSTLYYLSLCAMVLTCLGSASVGEAAETETGEVAESWRAQPRGRGTWTILQGCIATLIITCWTVIHDEVIHNGTSRTRLASKTLWMLYTLLEPELTAVCAAYQWMVARDVHKWWCGKLRVKPGSDEDRLGHEGAFFVVMGGYTVGPCDYYGRYPEGLDPVSFKRLIDDGAISPTAINKQLISDRGKADWIAKGLSLLQALWLAVVCIARVIERMPVTLLELHVLVKVLWTALIYAFWWHKPLGVCEPISVIEHEGIGDALTIVYRHDKPILMAVLPSLSASETAVNPGVLQPLENTAKASTGITEPNPALTSTPDSSPGPSLLATDALVPDTSAHTELEISTQSQSLRDNYLRNEDNEVPSGTWLISGDPMKRRATRTFGTGEDIKNVVVMQMNGSLTGNTGVPMPGWDCEQLAQRRKGSDIILLPGESLIIMNSILVRFCGVNNENTFVLSRNEITDLEEEARRIRTASKGQEGMDTSTGERSKCRLEHDYHAAFSGTVAEKQVFEHVAGVEKCMRAVFERPGKRSQTYANALVNAAFTLTAVGHFLAWNSFFPTPTERLLWRISCVGLAALPWLWFVIEETIFRSRPWKKMAAVRLPIFICTFTFSLYLLVESFISVRWLPASAYNTPRWVLVLPHI